MSTSTGPIGPIAPPGGPTSGLNGGTNGGPDGNGAPSTSVSYDPRKPASHS